MANKNFFVDGGTVQAQEGAIYLSRGADDQLLELCRAGTFAYVLSARQMGKSSLMVNTAERLAAEGIRSAEVDLNRIGVKVTKDEWYLGVLFEICFQLDLRQEVTAWWRSPERADLSTAQRLLLFFEEVVLAQVSEPVVVFVDEIETTLRLDFTDDFFAAVRSVHNARSRSRFERLTFVLIGVATPDSLIRDQQLTPFNVGRGVVLSDFTLEEATPLAAGFGLAAGHARSILGRVLHWSGGHPYLTQRLCRSIAETVRPSWDEGDVDEVVARVFFGDKSYEDSNLRFIREMLLTSELEREEVLSTYRDILRGRRPVPDEEQALVKSHLKLSGVVRREGSALRVRNLIYRRVFDESWIASHYPINWARRLTRVAAGFILVLLLLSAPLAMYAWKQKGEAEENLKKANALGVELRRALDREKTAREALQVALSSESMAKTTAEKNRASAEEQRGIAEYQRSQAEKQSREAKRQQQAAEAQKREAQEQRRLAEGQRREAQHQRALAEGQRLEAEKQKKRAMAQRQMSMARQAELQADRAMSEGNFLAAQVLYAKALSYDDTLETKGRYLEARTKALLEPLKKSPLTYEGGAFALSPDGQQVAMLSGDNEIDISDVRTGKLITKLKGHKDDVTAVRFSPNGRHLTSSSTDGTIRTWDSAGGKEIRNFQYKEAKAATEETDCCDEDVSLMAYSHDSKLLATSAGEGVVTIRDAASGLIIRTLVPPLPEVHNLEFGPEGDLAVSSQIGVAVIWSGEDYKTLRFIEHGSFLIGINFSAGGKFITAGGSKIKIWDFAANGGSKPTLTINPGSVKSVFCSRDGKTLAVGTGDGTIKLIDTRDGRNVLEMDSYSKGLEDVRYGEDGSVVAFTRGGRILLWEAKRVKPVVVLAGEKDPLNDVTFNRNADKVATIGGDGIVRVWELASFKVIRQVDVRNRINRQVYGNDELLYVQPMKLLFAPDDKSILLLGVGLKILLVGIESGSVSEFPLPEVEGGEDTMLVTDAAYSPNGQWIVLSTSAGHIILKNLRDHSQRPRIINAHSEPITCLSFSPDSRHFSSSSFDKTVRIWEVMTGQNVRTFNNTWGYAFLSVAYSPDGRLLASSSMDQKIRIWDVGSGAETLNHEIFDPTPISVSFSPDGRLLAWSSSNQNLIRLLDIDTGEELPPLNKKDGISAKVQFSPNNKWLASSGEGTDAILWNMEVIRAVYGNPSSSLLKTAEEETGLYVKGIAIEQLSQVDLYVTLAEDTESAYNVIPAEERNARKGANCSPVPIVPTFNPFPLTFRSPAELCKNYAPLDLRLVEGGKYSTNSVVWKTGLKAQAGDEIYALIYIDNGVANNLPPEVSIAKNVKVSTFVESGAGPEHRVAVVFGGDHTNQVSHSLKVLTGPHDFLEVVPHSGGIYDYTGNPLKENMEVGNNTIFLGDIAPGFTTGRFVRFKIRVKMNATR